MVTLWQMNLEANKSTIDRWFAYENLWFIASIELPIFHWITYPGYMVYLSMVLPNS